MKADTLYDLLGIEQEAGSDEIRSAYLRLSKTYHPDRGGTSAFFRQLQQAYETLSDPSRRQAYDLSLTSPPQPTQTQGRPRTRSASTGPRQGQSDPVAQSHSSNTASTRRKAMPPANPSGMSLRATRAFLFIWTGFGIFFAIVLRSGGVIMEGLVVGMTLGGWLGVARVFAARGGRN
jgi:curved DNA-binding protein CbpA